MSKILAKSPNDCPLPNCCLRHCKCFMLEKMHLQSLQLCTCAAKKNNTENQGCISISKKINFLLFTSWGYSSVETYYKCDCLVSSS